jgi:sugar O-acyltransferase (sialic acid O-acetyltransferase NeuD family)
VLRKARRKKRVAVYGASGHAKVIIDIIECEKAFEIACIIDDNPDLKGQRILGYKVIGGRDHLLASRKRLRIDAVIVAIGDNRARQRVAAWLDEKNFDFARAVHPSAVIGRDVELGAGTVVMPGAIINTDARIGEHVIINTAATVDHDCDVGDFVHIAPGAHLCGGVTVGRGSLICAGAVVIPNRTIGANAIAGAGSTVIHDVPGGVTATGLPARIRKKRE